MSITAMKQALETLEKITKPHPFTRQVAAILRTAIEQAEKQCCCGEPAAFGVVHRTDGPCYVAEKHKEYMIEFDTSGASSVLGRLLRLLAFPFVWVLTGKAKL